VTADHHSQERTSNSQQMPHGHAVIWTGPETAGHAVSGQVDYCGRA